jgi:hypothetical protein
MTQEEAFQALENMTEDDFVTVAPEDDVSDDFIERLVEAAHRQVGPPSLDRCASSQATFLLPSGTEISSRSVERRRHEAIEGLTRFAGAYPPGYLEELRGEWPQ